MQREHERLKGLLDSRVQECSALRQQIVDLQGLLDDAEDELHLAKLRLANAQGHDDSTVQVTALNARVQTLELHNVQRQKRRR